MCKLLPRGAVCVLVALASAGTAFATTGDESDQQLIQFDFWGFSIAPDPVQVGDRLELVAALNQSTTFVPLNLDFANNEYTVHVRDLRLSSIIPNGPLLELHFEGGFVDIYEDPSFNAPFNAQSQPGEVPPLDPAEVPANFQDGDLLVRFKILNYIALWYDPAGIGTLAYTHTQLRATGGSALPDLQAIHRVVGWHMGGGYTNDQGAFIPPGYGMRYDTLIRWENPLPVQPATWGGIKATFKN